MTTHEGPVTRLEDAIEIVLVSMTAYQPHEEEYAKMVDQLDKLYKIQTLAKGEGRVSKETLVTVGANLLGIVLILGYEKAHIVTSKALGFVLKTRV